MTRQIFNELHNIFTIVRQLISDNRNLLESIDEAYESVLMSDLQLIPEQYDADILKVIQSIKIIFTNINYSAISKGIGSITGGILHFHINTYNEFKQALEKIDMNKKDRLRIFNLVSKFQPLFSTIDYILLEPIKYIRKAAELSNHDYADIF